MKNLLEAITGIIARKFNLESTYNANPEKIEALIDFLEACIAIIVIFAILGLVVGSSVLVYYSLS